MNILRRLGFDSGLGHLVKVSHPVFFRSKVRLSNKGTHLKSGLDIQRAALYDNALCFVQSNTSVPDNVKNNVTRFHKEL